MLNPGPSNAATAASWLPPGKSAALSFHIDDVHPGTSGDPYEAGGDLADGALGHVEWLLERHPSLHVTLFTTADWREISPAPTRRLLARIPWLRERVYLARIHEKGTMRLDRHRRFVEYVSGLPRTEVALHGLHHVHVGPRIPVEFADRSHAECLDMLGQALDIFAAAGLPKPSGMQPPAWDLPEPLARAMVDLGMTYACSARDILTPVAADAVTAMSGVRGAPLCAPTLVQDGRLVHIPTNFQATNHLERALAIAELGGVISIKGHIIKNAMGHLAVDGMDGVYGNYLDLLFSALEERLGDRLWWTSCAELGARFMAAQGTGQGHDDDGGDDEDDDENDENEAA